MKREEITKILIIRFGALGDVVHSSGLFRSIKKAYPDVKIQYLCFKAPSMLIQNDPDIDKVWILENKSYKYIYKIAKKIKKEGIDLILNLQPSIRTKILSLLTGAKKSILYKKTFKLHAVENFWKTALPIYEKLEPPNKLKLYLPQGTKEHAKTLVKTDKPLVAFNMGTSITRQGRKWPIEYWQKLAQIMLEKYDCEIILTGSNEDRELAEQLTPISPRIKSFCGELNITQSAGMLSLCKLTISSDTGPLHIGTAVGSTCIGIYGAAPISRTGPYGDKHFAINSERKCVPCNRRKCKLIKNKLADTPCILDIKPENILNIVDTNKLMQ